MIAHKKQFKIAGAIWLVIVMIICQIVPAFASLPTDDEGNWSPSRYYITWYIYDTDTGEYNTVNVTSSVTVDGLTFTFPYNSTGVTRVQMFLYTDLSSNVYIDGISFDGYLTYQSSTLSGLLELSSSSIYSRYYYSGEDLLHVNTSLGTDNPFSFAESYDTLVPFNRCRLTFYPSSAVSGYFTIVFNSFVLGGEDISSLITVQNLDNASEDLGDLADELSVPTPDIDTIFNGMEDSISYIDDDNYQSTYSFFQNDTGIIATYITIVLAMATLGYILFGKRSG